MDFNKDCFDEIINLGEPMEFKRHCFDEIFDHENQKNVYLELLDGSYICHGGDLFDSDEMEKMLDESKLSLEEMEYLYDEYEELAMNQIRARSRHFLTEYNRVGSAETVMADFYRHDTDNKVTNQFRLLFAFRQWLVYLFLFQVSAAIGIVVVSLAKRLPKWLPFYVVGFVMVSWLLSSLFLLIWRKSDMKKDVDSLVWDIVGGIIAPEKDDVMYDRNYAAYSFQNTYLMYDVLGKRIDKIRQDISKKAV